MQVYNFFITLLCKLSRAFTAGSAVTGDHRDDFPEVDAADTYKA